MLRFLLHVYLLSGTLPRQLTVNQEDIEKRGRSLREKKEKEKEKDQDNGHKDERKGHEKLEGSLIILLFLTLRFSAATVNCCV